MTDNMTILQPLFFVLGLAMLAGGAEILVRGGSQLAVRWGVNPLVIGLTVVAFGTSAPEMAVSVSGALRGSPSIALGNVVGSNVFNTLAILGTAAIIAPLKVHAVVIRRETPIMIGVTLAVFVLAGNGWLGRFEGIVLVSALFGYTVFCLRSARREAPEIAKEYAASIPPRPAAPLWRPAVFVAGGLALLIAGSQVLVHSAVAMASAWGVSEKIIALTLVAAGTSLPELATSLVAAVRKETDIAVGNIIGSNIFNLLGILGVTAIVAPLAVDAAALRIDFPVMALVSLAVLPVMLSSHSISRTEGIVLSLGYVVYAFWLLMLRL